MEIKDIQKKNKPEKRSIPIGIRVTKTHSRFMKENNISPTKLFIKSLEGVMEKK